MPRMKKSNPSSLSSEEQSMELDRIVHEPSRLRILAALNKMDDAGFKFLEAITKLPSGNLSTQTTKLEEAGYITIRKTFKGKIPESRYSITQTGKEALALYKKRMRTLLDIDQEQAGEQPPGNKAGSSSYRESPNPQPGIP